MDKWETAVIAVASVVLGIYGGWGEVLATNLLKPGTPPPDPTIHRLWPIIDVIVVTAGCLLLLWCYKRLRVGCYPSTFIYCFNMPSASNPSGKSQVLGHCHIKPDMDNGEIIVEGASYFWENGQLDIDSRVGFTSTQVCATEENGETTCQIRFSIDKEDLSKRLYRHGLLQFRLTNTEGRTAVSKGSDVYAGYLRSMHKDIEIQEVEVQSRGYAERFSRGNLVERDVQATLAGHGEVLFARLNALLKATPAPSLWKARDYMRSNHKNVWGHQIPTPQSVILNPTLYPHVDKFLSKVLALIGLDTTAIDRFKRLAAQKARVDETLAAYEWDLKAGLIGQTVRNKEDKALTNRANVIYAEVMPYLEGDSLLDIGCGNGLISNLARDRFKRLQLLDVVQYVTPALNLPFQLYQAGHPLPTNELFDTVLLLTVLHHSNNPVELLKLAWGATKKKLIIIESVVGVHQLETPANYELVELPDEDQIAYAAFVDWFYNRVLHDDVPVPYNFTTPEEWQSIFVKNKMHLAQTIHLGQDIDIGPEYHILFVLEKQLIPTLQAASNAAD